MKISTIKKNKAQSGSQAAILVIVITVLLILFILSISPEDREQLLGEDNAQQNGSDPSFPNAITLLRANPGRIQYSPDNEIVHEFAPFMLNAEVKGELIHTKNSLYLKNSAFQKITDTLTFTVTPNLTSNVLLNFNVEKSSGSLMIKLNGQTIFNAPISTGNAPPISIAVSNLKQQNTLEFSVSGPGAAFWRYNEYLIRNINIYGDILDLSRSKTTQVFSVSPREADKLTMSSIRYLPTCRQGTIKELIIDINHFNIFRGVPDCEVFNQIPIPTQYIHKGVNEISFQVKEGTTLIDRARIRNILEKPEIITYYFEVRDKYFNFVANEYVLKNNYEAILDITFPNTEHKRFELIINGKTINFNTARLRETRNMQLFLQPGTNSIQINPQNELSITEIRVRIREK